MREALAQIVDEGLDLFKLRHAENAQRLHEGLQNIGLELFVENPDQRLPSITPVRIPHGVKLEAVIKHMMERCVFISEATTISDWAWFVNSNFCLCFIFLDTRWRYRMVLALQTV